jgi:hypothetical protein
MDARERLLKLERKYKELEDVLIELRLKQVQDTKPPTDSFAWRKLPERPIDGSLVIIIIMDGPFPKHHFVRYRCSGVEVIRSGFCVTDFHPENVHNPFVKRWLKPDYWAYIPELPNE